jgi:hypothetical protein
MMNEENITLTSQELELIMWFRNMNETEQNQWQDFFRLACEKNINPKKLKSIVEELLCLNMPD